MKPIPLESLIGPAAKAGKILTAKAARNLSNGCDAMKLLLYGPPGTGKTTVANLVAECLTGGVRLAIEESNGKNVRIDTVRGWMDQLKYGSLWGSYTVRIVNELDLVPRDAQELLLSYLDEMPTGSAFVGTSNLQLDLLAERFQSRLQQYRITGPDESEIADYIVEKFGLSRAEAEGVAFGAGGNVRAAMLDAEALCDAKLV